MSRLLSMLLITSLAIVIQSNNRNATGIHHHHSRIDKQTENATSGHHSIIDDPIKEKERYDNAKKGISLPGWNESQCGICDASHPHMTTAELSFLTGQMIWLRNSIVLEWGSGGSTNLFASYARHTFSIEHAKTFCSYMTDKNATACNINNKKLTYICMNHTEGISMFGIINLHPEQIKRISTGYIGIADQIFDSMKPDVIFVDGRFRVAAAMKGLQLLQNKTFDASSGYLMIHDYVARQRDHYFPLENHFYDRVALVDSLVLLRPKPVIDWELFGRLYDKYLREQLRIRHH